MFDKQHYVPIMKPKAGETWALKTLRSPWRSQIRQQRENDLPAKVGDWIEGGLGAAG